MTPCAHLLAATAVIQALTLTAWAVAYHTQLDAWWA